MKTKLKQDVASHRALKWSYLAISLLFLPLILLPGNNTARAAASQSETGYHAMIQWDTWGVPHIFARDNPSLFFAFGYAQMQNHADLLLTLYGEARGRAAEYWGASYLSSDEFIQTMGYPDRAQQWFNAQTPEFRGYLTAFAAGINYYAQQHPEQIDPSLRVVLPIRPTDILAHGERVLGDFLLPHCQGISSAFAQHTGAADQGGSIEGSNGWAVGPRHSVGGDTMLLANPHLLWGGEYTFFEAQLHSPSVSTYGATLVGFPVLAIAFNPYLAWTHTVNMMDGCDDYLLMPSGNGYIFDGQVRSFVSQTKILLVKQADGSMQQQQLVVQRSIQGPIFHIKTKKSGGTAIQTVAIRIVGVDQFPAYGVWQEWWDMGRARNLDEFQDVLRRLQLPTFTVIYSDNQGHVMSLFNGEVPRHPVGDWSFWESMVPGDTSATLWTSLYSYNELPKVIDPPADWVQNANSPPWYTTFPQQLNPRNFPSDMTQPCLTAQVQCVSFREQQGIHMLTTQDRLSFGDLINDKFSTHMGLTDRVLDDLIADALVDGSPLAVQAAHVLQGWDRTADADSKGSVLFYLWVNQLEQSSAQFFSTPWDPQHPLTTPTGLADAKAAVSALETVAQEMLSLAGTLDLTWGTVFRLQRGNLDLPASGAPGDPFGVFRALYFTQNSATQFSAASGDSYIAVVEFSQPLRARVLLTYGNSSQPGSPHNGDQLALYARNQMREAWLTEPQILSHLASQDTFS